MLRFDLQAHSTASDGALAPGDVVRAAHAAGVELLALTDHDSVAGVDEALAAAATLDGIRVVPAIEVSALDEDGGDLHVCGYGLDHHDPALLAALESWRADRVGRSERMVAALRELGWTVDETPLVARREAGGTIGRPHVAAAAFDHPDNAARCAAEGLATATDLLVAYLTPGAPAYRDRTRPSVAEAIEVLHAAGGVAVWAHPFWDVDEPADVAARLTRFAALGLDGVEVFYPSFDEARTRFLAREAQRLGLLRTGSADFHGPDHPVFSAFRTFSTYGLPPELGPIAA